MKWKHSLAGRMLAFSLIVSSILLIIQGSVLTGLSENVLLSEVVTETEQMLLQTNRLLDSKLQSICSRIIRLTSLPSVIRCLNGTRLSHAAALPYERIIDDSLSNIDLFLPVSDVLILGNNGYVYNIGRRQDLDSSFKFTETDWYRKAISVEKGVYIQLLFLPDQLYYAERIKYTLRQQRTVAISMAVCSRDYRIIGAIVCTLDPKDLAEMFIGDNAEQHKRIALLDASGAVCVQSNGAQADDRLPMDEEAYAKLNAASSGNFIAQIDGIPHLICHDTSKFSGWKLVSYVPLREIRSHASPLYRFFLAALLCSFLLNLLLAILFARSVRKPVNALTLSLSQVDACADSLKLIPIRKEYTELEQISEKFNELLSRIDMLIRKDYRTQLELSRFELSALQAQINPHFLFNTLQLLQTEILYGNVEKSDRIIVTLSQLMRYYMANGESTVSVRREMEYLKKYMMLFAAKYEGRMSFRIDVRPEAEELTMPKLLIQPVVENAIRHAADITSGNIDIVIDVSVCDSTLILLVKDNGCGIEETRLQEIRDGLERRVDWMKNSVGLANVHQRIRTAFGSDYGLAIDSSPDGTAVQLRMPAISDEGGNA